MSSVEDKMIKKLEEMNMPEFVIQDAFDMLITDEDRQKLLDFIQEERKFGEVARKIARIVVESDAYGEELDDNDELEEE